MDLTNDPRPFLVMGRVGFDVIIDPPGTNVRDAQTAQIDIGGSSANIAVGLCKLGHAAALLTTVSDDEVATFCTKKLESYGVSTDLIRRVPGEARVSLAVYDSRITDHSNTIYRNNAADFLMSDEDVEAVDYSAYRALITAGTVFAAEPSRSAAFKAFDLAKAAGLPVVFDVDYRPYSWPSPEVAADVLSRAGAASDVIVGNDEEFGFMAGGYEEGPAKAQELAAECRMVVYKKGPDGAVTYHQGQTIETGIYRVEALKPEGAGDSFMAGLMAGLSEGRDLKEAILRGSAYASITVSKPGCAPAMALPDELEQFLKNHPGPSAPGAQDAS